MNTTAPQTNIHTGCEEKASPRSMPGEALAKTGIFYERSQADQKKVLDEFAGLQKELATAYATWSELDERV